MNTVIITGRLAQDPELKTTGSGTEFCNLSVAVQRNYKNAEGKYDVDFINCVAWRQTATFISQYFQKGSGIEISGSLQQETWEKDGKKMSRVIVKIDNVAFGTGSSKEHAAPKAEPKKEQTSLFEDELKEFNPIDDPDLPF